ncbi:MAG: mannose-1-phosphate guanylyltransferase [Candidatus Omnitrophica bacterium]|nr:mannose-1-phosphate guanylyltransferase [Candidatus Omnitrophota bacterium]
MAENKITNNVYAVILVGGQGKRLRPLSTDIKPKAFLSIMRDGKTMFGRTVERISRMIPKSNIIVVANASHERLVKKCFKNIKRGNLLLEPVSRNTGPAVAYASSALNTRNADALLVVLPADHYVTRTKDYLSVLRCGIDFALDNEAVVVIGINPVSPSTEYGYIRIHCRREGERVCKVEKFTEKPDLKTAKGYIKSGHYLWNSGIFIFRASVMLKLIKLYAPKINSVLGEKCGATKAYPKFPDISLDYSIMEKAHNIYCLKGDYGWKDVGSFNSLKSVLRRESRRFIEKDGKVIKIL